MITEQERNEGRFLWLTEAAWVILTLVLAFVIVAWMLFDWSQGNPPFEQTTALLTLVIELVLGSGGFYLARRAGREADKRHKKVLDAVSKDGDQTRKLFEDSQKKQNIAVETTLSQLWSCISIEVFQKIDFQLKYSHLDTAFYLGTLFQYKERRIDNPRRWRFDAIPELETAMKKFDDALKDFMTAIDDPNTMGWYDAGDGQKIYPLTAIAAIRGVPGEHNDRQVEEEHNDIIGIYWPNLDQAHQELVGVIQRKLPTFNIGQPLQVVEGQQRQSADDQSGKYRAADIKTLEKLWPYITSPIINYIVERTGTYSLGSGIVAQTIYKYGQLRTDHPELHFLDEKLETTFAQFDESLHKFGRVLSVNATVEPYGGHWVYLSNYHEAKQLDRVTQAMMNIDWQLLLSRQHELEQAAVEFRQAHQNLVQSVRRMIPEFHFSDDETIWLEALEAQREHDKGLSH